MKKDQFIVWWGSKTQNKSLVDMGEMIIVDLVAHSEIVCIHKSQSIYIIDGYLCCKGPLTGGDKVPLVPPFQKAFQKYVNKILEEEVLIEWVKEEALRGENDDC